MLATRCLISFAIICIFGVPCFAQKYDTNYLMRKADSAMMTRIPPRIFRKHFFAASAFCMYANKSGEIMSKSFRGCCWYNSVKHVKVKKGRFMGLRVYYQVIVEETREVNGDYPNWALNAMTEALLLDSDFKLISDIDTAIIPQNIFKGLKTSEHITPYEAASIAKRQYPISLDEEGVKEHYEWLRMNSRTPYLEVFEEPYVEYSTALKYNKQNGHYWEVKQTVNCGRLAGYIESIEDEYKKKYKDVYSSIDIYRTIQLNATTGEPIHISRFSNFTRFH